MTQEYDQYSLVINSDLRICNCDRPDMIVLTEANLLKNESNDFHSG